MNIQTRLKKLEGEIPDGEFCACNGRERVYKHTYADEGVLRNPEDAVDEYCGVCLHQINKCLIIVDYVSDAGTTDNKKTNRRQK
jgi:hypothetical protein